MSYLTGYGSGYAPTVAQSALFERGWLLEYPGTSLQWGGRDPSDPFRRGLGRLVNLDAPEVTDTALTTEDATIPRSDGTRFGQDYRGGRTWTFNLGVRAHTEMEARTVLADAERAWRGDGVRLLPGAMAVLTTKVNGQQLSQYGRPRKFTRDLKRINGAVASALATFDAMDDVAYALEQSVRMTLAASVSGGFTFPAIFPLVMSAPTTQAGGLVVTGNLPAWAVAEVHGPITNPVVQLGGGWRVQLLGSILAGRSVTIDPRPYVRAVVDQDGASWAGQLTRASRLQDMLLPLGQQQVALTGNDPTGTAYLTVRWQPAYAGMI